MSEHDPSACRVCGRHAIGIGLSPKATYDWLCRECVDLVDRVKDIRRLDPYELKAREGGMDAAAPLVAEYGPDLSQWEEEQVLIFVGAVWRGCADRMRALIRDGSAPF